MLKCKMWTCTPSLIFPVYFVCFGDVFTKVIFTSEVCTMFVEVAITGINCRYVLLTIYHHLGVISTSTHRVYLQRILSTCHMPDNNNTLFYQAVLFTKLSNESYVEQGRLSNG